MTNIVQTPIFFLSSTQAPPHDYEALSEALSRTGQRVDAVAIAAGLQNWFSAGHRNGSPRNIAGPGVGEHHVSRC
jgi:hypothetical protein